jgi:hypothetical protein
MKISDRFTDYGLIGGLFWMMQALLLWLIMPGSASLPVELIKNIGTISPGAQSVLTALLGALAVVVIFTTGLLLDLFGSFYLRYIEMTAFHALAKTNESWLRRLFEKYPDYVQSDWTLLLRLPSWWSKQQWIAGLKVFVFWNARYRKEYAEELRANLVPRGSYVRLQALLFSYVFLHSGTENIELLTNQISLWNTSRTIAAVLALFAVEAPLLWIFSGRQFLLPQMFSYLVQLLFTAAAFAITTAAFRRVCSTLLALAYLIDHKANESASAANA